MRHSICFATTLLACAANANAAAHTDITPDGHGSPALIKRIGGDLVVEATRTGETYRCGNSVVETSLPAGYPAPTPPVEAFRSRPGQERRFLQPLSTHSTA
jgi:hypothetical protein